MADVLWLWDRHGQPVLLLIAPHRSPGRLVASAYFAGARLTVSRHLIDPDGTTYRSTKLLQPGFHNGPIQRAAGAANYPDIEITLEEVT
jgi:hypothetical protein